MLSLYRRTSKTSTDVLAACLDRPEAYIAAAFAFDGTLPFTGVIELEPRRFSFNDTVNLLNCVIEELRYKHDDPITYFRDRVVKSFLPCLTAGHFSHVARDQSILRKYLVESLAERRRGVNVLIYGETGTGKAEFIRVRADELDAALYEVAAARTNAAYSTRRSAFGRTV